MEKEADVLSLTLLKSFRSGLFPLKSRAATKSGGGGCFNIIIVKLDWSTSLPKYNRLRDVCMEKGQVSLL